MRISFVETLEWMLRRPFLIIIAIAVVTSFFAYQLPNLSFKTSIYDLQIEDLPETSQYREFKKLFGSDEIIRVVIKTDNVFDAVAFRKIEQLAETAAAIEGVGLGVDLAAVSLCVLVVAVGIATAADHAAGAAHAGRGAVDRAAGRVAATAVQGVGVAVDLAAIGLHGPETA